MRGGLEEYIASRAPRQDAKAKIWGIYTMDQVFRPRSAGIFHVGRLWTAVGQKRKTQDSMTFQIRIPE